MSHLGMWGRVRRMQHLCTCGSGKLAKRSWDVIRSQWVEACEVCMVKFARAAKVIPPASEEAQRRCHARKTIEALREETELREVWE